MIRWVPVDDKALPPPAGEIVPIARSDYAVSGAGYCQYQPRQRRAPRQIWFNQQNRRIRAPDWYGVQDP